MQTCHDSTKKEISEKHLKPPLTANWQSQMSESQTGASLYKMSACVLLHFVLQPKSGVRSLAKKAKIQF
jgi:hypothetical protein